MLKKPQFYKEIFFRFLLPKQSHDFQFFYYLIQQLSLKGLTHYYKEKAFKVLSIPNSENKKNINF